MKTSGSSTAYRNDPNSQFHGRPSPSGLRHECGRVDDKVKWSACGPKKAARILPQTLHLGLCSWDAKDLRSGGPESRDRHPFKRHKQTDTETQRRQGWEGRPHKLRKQQGPSPAATGGRAALDTSTSGCCPQSRGGTDFCGSEPPPSGHWLQPPQDTQTQCLGHRPTLSGLPSPGHKGQDGLQPQAHPGLTPRLPVEVRHLTCSLGAFQGPAGEDPPRQHTRPMPSRPNGGTSPPARPESSRLYGAQHYGFQQRQQHTPRGTGEAGPTPQCCPCTGF